MSLRRIAIPLLTACCLFSGTAAFGRIWTGAFSSSWSDARNWNPVGVPAPLELNDYPSSAVNHVVNIDVPAGTVFGTQAFVGNYTVNGNRVYLYGGISARGNVTWNPDILCIGNAGFNAPDGGQLTVTGTVEVNAQTITSFGASFTGALNGGGTIISPRLDWPITITGGGNFSGTITGADFFSGALRFSGNLPNATVSVPSLTASGANPTLGKVTIRSFTPGSDLGVLHTKTFQLSGTLGVAVRGDGGSSIQVTGTANVQGELSIAINGVPPVGTRIKIIDSSDGASGSFSGWSPFVANTVGSATYYVNYRGGDGNDIELVRATDIPTTTVLTQSSTQTAYFQPVTFNVTVTSVASGTPSGSVGFVVDGNASNVTLQNGSAAFTVATMEPGTHTIRAEYRGISHSYAHSDSSPLSHTVTKGSTASTIQPVASAVYGQLVLFRVAVSPQPPAGGLPTGTATVLANGVAIGTASANGGTANVSTSVIHAGSNAITARYSGDMHFDPSTASAITLEVAKAPTSIDARPKGPVLVGNSSRMTVVVTPTVGSSVVSSGTLTVTEGATTLVSDITPSDGLAEVTIHPLLPGTHALQIAYGGSADFQPSTQSATLTVGVPHLSVSGAQIAEGNNGMTNVSVVVKLSDPAAAPVRVAFSTLAASATEGVDYEKASGVLQFAVGEQTRAIELHVIGDLFSEGDETFSIVLSDPINAMIETSSAPVVIANDDLSPPRRRATRH